jgi:hypothetical protein
MPSSSSVVIACTRNFAPIAAGAISGVRLGTVGVADRVIRAVGMLQRRPLGPVSGLADAVGLSERQLRRRVESAVGYGPKRFARILRFSDCWICSAPRATGLAGPSWRSRPATWTSRT